MGAFIGTTLVLFVVAAVLLASRDLWNIEARAVGRLLGASGVRHEVITSETRLARVRVGAFTRSGHARAANAPVVRVAPPRRSRPTPLQAGAGIVALVATVAALARSKRFPTPLKGFALVAGLVAVGSLAYGAWWSSVPPLDVRAVLVDWRTSALAPIVGVALLFAYDVYPLPGSFVVKTVWLAAAITCTAVFSTVRLSAVVAGYAAFGPPAFLALHQAAGIFWDLAPGIGVLALAHAGLSVTPPATELIRRRWRTR